MMQTSRAAVIHTYDGPWRHWQRWHRSIGKRLGWKVTGSRYALAALAAEIETSIDRACKGIVQQGPFAGMALLHDDKGSSKTSKLLGTYESEIYPAIEMLTSFKTDVIVNVGCASGYFAVGFARRMPHAKVFAFDTDARARSLCAEAAALNGVADRVVIDGECTVTRLHVCIEQAREPFLFLDCEGFERDLLLMEDASALSRCRMLVECHDHIDPTITSKIEAAFARTHTIHRIEQGARNPNAIPLMQHWPDRDRWLAICEYRREVMHWLFLEPSCGGQ
jgi:hypothetical protein